MRILHINCADFGSTGKIIQDISTLAVRQGHQSYLCCPKVRSVSKEITKFGTSFPYEQGLYRRIAKVLGFQYGFAPVSTWRILRKLKKVKPDIVHLHSINCNMVSVYKLVSHLKKKSIPTVITNHAEFFYTGSCAHAYECEKWKNGCGRCMSYKEACASMWDSSGIAWRKMKKAFDGLYPARVVSVSPFIYTRSTQSPIFNGISQTTILNGINTDIFHPYEGNSIKSDFEEKPVVLFVTAYFDPIDTEKKGGAHIVELARRFESDQVAFLVVGSSVERKMALPDNLIKVGFVQGQDMLAKYYSAADLTVITSKRETFSMPVAESLACGTPIVGFCAGGPESITINEFSEFVEFGNVDALERAVRQWISKKKEIGEERISALAAEKYKSMLMAQSYIDIYQKVVQENEDRNLNIS